MALKLFESELMRGWLGNDGKYRSSLVMFLLLEICFLFLFLRGLWGKVSARVGGFGTVPNPSVTV